MAEIVQLPSPKLIKELIKRGILDESKENDVRAAVAALDGLRKDSAKFLKQLRGDDDFPPAA